METLILAAAILIGLIFLTVEFFLVPGFSIPGVIGILAIGYGVYLSYVEYGFLGSLLTVLGSILVIALLIRGAVRSRAMRTFSLGHTQEGGTAADDYSPLLGKTGVALSTLRPSGTAEIEQNRYSVVTDGEYIEENTEIVVEAVEGSRIQVTVHQRG